MKLVSALVMATAIAMPRPAVAQQTITESDYLAPLQRDGSPSVLALGEELARAEAARIRAGTLSNPRLSYEREAPEENPVQNTIALAWSPPLDGRLGLAKAAADAGVEAARLRLTLERTRLRADLRKAYAEWALASERRATLATHRSALDALATQSERRAEAGEEAGMSARRLRLAAVEAAGALATAIAEEGRATAQARALRPDLPEGARPEPPPLPSLRDAANGDRPELAAFRADVRQAELEARLGGRIFVFPEIEVGWQRLSHDGRSQSGPVVGAALTLPIFDRSQAARLDATRKREIAAAKLALAESRIAAEISAARSSYETLRTAAGEASTAIGGADRVLEAATAAFRAGESTLTDLLDVTRAVRDARVNELDLRRAALEAHRNLEVALGRPLPEGASR